MTFLRSILVLTAVCLCIAFAYFFGHALAVHSVRPILYGAVLLLIGAGMLFLLGRRGERTH
jgi:hypothetical protein